VGLDSTGDPVMNLPWTYAGLPVVSIPTGRNAAGLPLGTQLIGRWYEDEKLLYWAELCVEALSAPASTG
jgi:Asp-tRNA(Asn)/Glu-tRNA(Gln) amidotransferase A subunit family amidase